MTAMAPTTFGLLDVDTAFNRGYLPAKVYLDGVEIDDPVVVNDIEGWVDCYVRDSKGNLIIDGLVNGLYDEDRSYLRKLRHYGVITFVPFSEDRAREIAGASEIV